MPGYTIVIIGVVQNENQILIGKKKSDEEDQFLTDKWHMPGGSLEKDEDEFVGVAREVREEAGIEVKVLKLLAERIEEDRNLHLKWFLCEALTTDIKAGDDLVDVKFVNKSEVFDHCSENVINQWPETLKEFFRT